MNGMPYCVLCSAYSTRSTHTLTPTVTPSQRAPLLYSEFRVGEDVADSRGRLSRVAG